MKATLSLLLFVCLTCRAGAQTPDPAAPQALLPSGPLLVRAPEFSAWQVTITEIPPPMLADQAPASGSPASKPKPRRTVVRITKTGKILHEESVDADGNKTSRWCAGASQYVQRTGLTTPLRVTGGGLGSDFVNYSASDFPDCAWVGPKSFTGMRKVNGHDCMVFGDKVDAALPASFDQKSNATDNGQTYFVQSAAYIDLDTRLPVAARRGDATYQYEFLSPPQTMQTLPADIDTVEKMEKQRQEDLMRKPAGA